MAKIGVAVRCICNITIITAYGIAMKSLYRHKRSGDIFAIETSETGPFQTQGLSV
jgi:hypothetical protein